ncbi:MAG: type III pantothenate kinase [Desulfovibrio sp.]
MNNYVLLFDVGNTNVKIGIANAKGVTNHYTLPTTRGETADSWGLKLMQICQLNNIGPDNIEAFVLSSVVPPLDPLFSRVARTFFQCEAHFVPVSIPLDLENKYERPEECGADRLVTAYAARQLFPDHERIIVVDYGTATTFDCVVGNACMGGLICPGILSSAGALSSGTAKLPQIDLELESDTIEISKSTVQSLNQGLIYGFASMTEGLITRLEGVLGGKSFVVATGGFAGKIASASSAIDEVCHSLLLDGLHMVWYKRN